MKYREKPIVKEIRIIGKKLTNQLIEGVKNEFLFYKECEFIDCTFAPYSADKPVAFCCCAFRSGQETITIEDETIKRTEELVKGLKASIATAVKNAKIFINDIQDGGDYAFASGIVSALKFIIDEETFIELNELLEKQTKWEK